VASRTFAVKILRLAGTSQSNSGSLRNGPSLSARRTAWTDLMADSVKQGHQQSLSGGNLPLDRTCGLRHLHGRRDRLRSGGGGGKRARRASTTGSGIAAGVSGGDRQTPDGAGDSTFSLRRSRTGTSPLSIPRRLLKCVNSHRRLILRERLPIRPTAVRKARPVVIDHHLQRKILLVTLPLPHDQSNRRLALVIVTRWWRNGEDEEMGVDCCPPAREASPCVRACCSCFSFWTKSTN
jgi:hypothetical protein